MLGFGGLGLGPIQASPHQSAGWAGPHTPQPAQAGSAVCASTTATLPTTDPQSRHSLVAAMTSGSGHASLHQLIQSAAMPMLPTPAGVDEESLLDGMDMLLPTAVEDDDDDDAGMTLEESLIDLAWRNVNVTISGSKTSSAGMVAHQLSHLHVQGGAQAAGASTLGPNANANANANAACGPTAAQIKRWGSRSFNSLDNAAAQLTVTSTPGGAGGQCGGPGDLGATQFDTAGGMLSAATINAALKGANADPGMVINFFSHDGITGQVTSLAQSQATTTRPPSEMLGGSGVMHAHSGHSLAMTLCDMAAGAASANGSSNHPSSSQYQQYSLQQLGAQAYAAAVPQRMLSTAGSSQLNMFDSPAGHGSGSMLLGSGASLGSIAAAAPVSASEVPNPSMLIQRTRSRRASNMVSLLHSGGVIPEDQQLTTLLQMQMQRQPSMDSPRVAAPGSGAQQLYQLQRGVPSPRKAQSAKQFVVDAAVAAQLPAAQQGHAADAVKSPFGGAALSSFRLQQPGRDASALITTAATTSGGASLAAIASASSPPQAATDGMDPETAAAVLRQAACLHSVATASGLPPSGDAQLDAYLLSLLHDPAPSKMLFYTRTQLTADACRAIATLLALDGATQQAVRVVALPRCGVSDAGLAELSEGLAACQAALMIDLSGNRLGDSGAKRLAEVMVMLTQLSEVRLSGNRLGDKGVLALTAAVKLCPNIRKVIVRGSSASSSIHKELSAACHANSRRQNHAQQQQQQLHTSLAQQGIFPPAACPTSAPAALFVPPQLHSSLAGGHQQQQQARQPGSNAAAAAAAATGTDIGGCTDVTMLAAMRLHSCEQLMPGGYQLQLQPHGHQQQLPRLMCMQAMPTLVDTLAASATAASVKPYGELQAMVRLLAEPSLPAEHAVASAVSRIMMNLQERQAQLQQQQQQQQQQQASQVPTSSDSAACVCDEAGPFDNNSCSSAFVRLSIGSSNNASTSGAAAQARHSGGPSCGFQGPGSVGAYGSTGFGGPTSLSASAVLQDAANVPSVSRLPSATHTNNLPASGAVSNPDLSLDVLTQQLGQETGGLRVVQATAVGGGAGGECLRNLRHTFLRVYAARPGPRVSLSGALAAASASAAGASTAADDEDWVLEDAALEMELLSDSGFVPAPNVASGLLDSGVSQLLHPAVDEETAATAFAGAAAGSTTEGESTNGASASASTAGGATTAFLPWSGSHIVVDPCFKDQFEVANPTPRYEAVLAALPRVYVGCVDRLPLLVEVLCDELSAAFKERGITLPPWREAAALITKWRPRRRISSRMLAAATAAAAADHRASAAGMMMPQRAGSRRASLIPAIGNVSSSGTLPLVQLPGDVSSNSTANGGLPTSAMVVGGLRRSIDLQASPRPQQQPAAQPQPQQPRPEHEQQVRLQPPQLRFDQALAATPAMPIMMMASVSSSVGLRSRVSSGKQLHAAGSAVMEPLVGSIGFMAPASVTQLPTTPGRQAAGAESPARAEPGSGSMAGSSATLTRVSSSGKLGIMRLGSGGLSTALASASGGPGSATTTPSGK